MKKTTLDGLFFFQPKGIFPALKMSVYSDSENHYQTLLLDAA